MIFPMSIQQHRFREDKRDTLNLVWGTTVLSAFIALAIDLRLCALIAAFGAFWVLKVMRGQLPADS